MAESVHGTGSAISNSRSERGRTSSSSKSGKEDKKRKRFQGNSYRGRDHIKKRRKRIIRIEAIICVVFLIIMVIIERYADRNNCGSAFWNFISDSGIQVMCGGLFDAIISLFFAYKNEKKIDRTIFGEIFLGIMALMLALVCLFTFSKIKGATSQKEETKESEEQKKNDEGVGSVAPPDRNSQNTQKTTVEYDINQDLYINDKPLEDYYTGEISEKDEKIIKAEILLNNLGKNLPKQNQLEDYDELLSTADVEYKTYLYQRKLTKNTDNDNDRLFSDRIEMLQKSLDNRKKADKESENPENERLLANGYKDKGDEYFGREKQNDAMEAYENGTEWYAKAIYHAAAIGDYKEMEMSMDLFKKLGEEVEKLDKIDPDRREKIKMLIEVYDIFVGKVLEGI